MSRTITIVIIDDYEPISIALHRLLSHEKDFQIVGTAMTANLGLEIVDIHKPDVALVDYELPDEDGLSLTKKILEVSPDTSVIILSGSPKVNAKKVEAAGGKDYLEKTIASRNLAEVIRSVVVPLVKE